MLHCKKCDEIEPEFHDINEEGCFLCSCHKKEWKPINGEKPLDRALRMIDEKISKQKLTQSKTDLSKWAF